MAAHDVLIREERSSDYEVIYALVKEAFASMPYAGGDEQDLINVLRSNRALVLALVAELNDVVVGHIAFSIARLVDSDQLLWALGPVAVAPKFQNRGIGAMLIEEGLRRACAASVIGCVLTDSPDYYRRFGFELAPNNVPPQESAEFFMLKLLSDTVPPGPIHFNPAFYSG